VYYIIPVNIITLTHLQPDSYLKSMTNMSAYCQHTYVNWYRLLCD